MDLHADATAGKVAPSPRSEPPGVWAWLRRLWPVRPRRATAPQVHGATAPQEHGATAPQVHSPAWAGLISAEFSDVAPAPLFLCNRQLRCLYVNQAWLRFRGSTLEQELDLGWQKGGHPDDLKSFSAGFSLAFADELPYAGQMRFKRADGEFRMIQTRAVPWKDASGNLIGFAGSCVDVTDSMLNQERMQSLVDELARAKALLERHASALEKENVVLEAEQKKAQSNLEAKNTFLALLSHELRTPLTAILGYADLIHYGLEANSNCGQWLEIIKRNGNHLLGLINDILDLSRMEAGKLQNDPLPFSPEELLEEIADLMRVRAHEQGLEFDVVFSGPMPHLLYADYARIRQILINLLGNAIKFTRRGMVRVVVEYAEEGADQWLKFRVEDTGIGMAPDLLRKLFEPFTQADASSSRSYSGTGLGLNICKRLLEVLGGSIEVESTLGVGTTFRVSVRVTQLRAGAAFQEPQNDIEVQETATTQDALRGAKILVADDCNDNLRLLWHLLSKRGANVFTVENGQKAIDHMERTIGTADAPALILMDVRMPVVDGHSATRAIRTMGFTGPIIALTAHALDVDRAACHAAGCSDFETKPIVRERLFARLDEWLRKAQPDALNSSDPAVESASTE